MSNFFKNIRKFSFSLGALLLAITLTLGSIAYWVNGAPGETMKTDSAEVVSDSMEIEEPEFEPPQRKSLALTQTAFNTPDEMKGVFLVPGSDFIKSKEANADTIKAEIDAAVISASESPVNSVVIDTVYASSGERAKVLFHTAGTSAFLSDFDIMEYAVNAVKEVGLHTYAIFDVSAVDGDTDKLAANAAEFAGKYALDGILIDGYADELVNISYGEYVKSGGSMGYDNYIRQAAATNVKTVVRAVHKATGNSTQAGILASAVWANAAQREDGSATNAGETALFTQNADTKSYVERKLVDFIAVKAYTPVADKDEPFGEIVSWWGSIAEASGIPMYAVCASSKVGGSFGADEIKNQLAAMNKADGCKGYIFDDLKKLADNPEQTNASNKDELVAKPMDTKPDDTSAKVVQTNTQPATTASQNTETASEYAKIDVIKEIYPTGLIEAEPGETIEVSALVRRGATVRGTIYDTPVFMTLDESRSSGSSDYAYYTGAFTVPDDYEHDFHDDYYEDDDGEWEYEDDDGFEYDGDDTGLNLGSLSVYANYGGQESTFNGAYFAATSTSSKKTPVQFTAEAKTYPTDTKDNVPIPSLYPLPKGAVDYVVGGSTKYTSSRKVTYTFVTLASGMRVESKYIKKINDGPKNNSISGMTVKADGNYTYVTLKTAQRVTYTPTYKSDSFQILFHNTVSVPGGGTLKSNPIFTKASWSGNNKLTLSFAKKGGFLGFKGYYDSNGNLVFRFNNPPTSIKNARIAIDPGHGGKDFGALGSNSQYPEKVLNLAIAQKLEAELKERGATVLLMDNAGIEGPERAQAAEKWQADFLISVHCNTAVNTSATGTEAFYFYPYSKQLATNAALNVSRQFNTLNRGAKLDYYHVTLSPQMASVLVECGFMTNKGEYTKLMKSSQQKKIATGIADSIEGAIKTAKTGVTSSGTQSTGNAVTSSNSSDDEDNESYETGGGKITDLYFDIDEIEIDVGETKRIKPIYEPNNADDPSMTWTSSKRSVATVDENGTVTGVRSGTATIKATSKDGSRKTASYTVVVSEGGSATAYTDSGVRLASAGYVYLDYDYLTIYPGNTERVEIVTDSGKTVLNADFTWKSSDSSVASVDKYGVVTAKAVGYATITAKGGSETLVCEVDVSKDKIAVKGVSLNKTSATVVRGNTEQLRATFSPRDATNRGITWTSTNSKIVSVSSSGLIKGENAGTATITAKTKDGSYKATCKVTVLKSAVKIDSIMINGYSKLEMLVGGTDILDISVSPDNATDSEVIWTSSNKNVVSVDSEGNIKALKKGSATITVTAKTNKNAYDTCRITVYD